MKKKTEATRGKKRKCQPETGVCIQEENINSNNKKRKCFCKTATAKYAPCACVRVSYQQPTTQKRKCFFSLLLK